MKQTRSTLRTSSLFALFAFAMWLLHTASAGADCPPYVDFTQVAPLTAADLENDATIKDRFKARVDAAQAFSAACPLDFKDGCNRRDLGQAFHHRLFARLASGDSARQEAIDYLRSVERSDMGEMGTTAPLGDFCETTFEDVLSFLPDLATDLGRHGDGDVAMIALATAVHKYNLSDDVTAHVLSLIDEEPTIGGVETVSFGLSTGAKFGICAAVCAESCPFGPIACLACGAACYVVLDGESIDAPETENHLNNIYVAQYLANQKRYELTGDPKYDNSRNGYRAKMIARMRDFVRNDFIEYNSHPYQRYTMFALLSLASFASDPAVKAAAKMALDYVSAKVVVSSNDLIRSTPFRRKDNPEFIGADLYDSKRDPQTEFYMMLAGNTDMIEPGRKVPAAFAEGFGWVAATDYKLDPLLLDLFVDRSHRRFYQFIHYSRVLQSDGFSDSNDELYFGSPSYLISAGGHPAHYAYTADVPFPINLIPLIGGKHPGQDVDRGATVPTTLMPTGDRVISHSRDKMIYFHVKDGENMCVAPNFACGLNPHVPEPPEPDAYPGRLPNDQVQAAGLDPQRWRIFDRADSAGDTNQYGYYLAVYRQDDFGFFEVYDTFPSKEAPASQPPIYNVTEFMKQVSANNPTWTFTRNGTNTYKTIDGTMLEFTVEKILTINGVKPVRGLPT